MKHRNLLLKALLYLLALGLSGFVGFYFGTEYAKPPTGEYRLVSCEEDNPHPVCSDDENYFTKRTSDDRQN